MSINPYPTQRDRDIGDLEHDIMLADELIRRRDHPKTVKAAVALLLKQAKNSYERAVEYKRTQQFGLMHIERNAAIWSLINALARCSEREARLLIPVAKVTLKLQNLSDL